MLRAGLKSLMARKVRLLMSAFAIILGVAFVAGSFVFTDTLGRSFDKIVSGGVGDVIVRPAGSDIESEAGQTDMIPAALVKQLASTPGAARADGNIFNYATFVVSKEGKLIGGGGPPGIGANHTGGPAAKGVESTTLTVGRWPRAPGEIVLDDKTARRAGYVVGEKVDLVTSGAQAQFRGRLVGIAELAAGGVGASMTIMSTQQAQTLYADGKNVFSDVWVTAADGTSQEELRSAVAQRLPKGLEAVTGDKASAEAASEIQEALGFITTFLLVFAGVALLVGSFLIVNTFSILVAQRSRELALLRAIGGTRRQVGRMVLIEAFIVGLLGSLIGLGVGLLIAMAIRMLFSQFGLDLSGQPLVVSGRTVVVAIVVGMVVTLVAAYLPARKAGKVPPVAAMRDDTVLAESGIRLRGLVGALLAIVGVALMCVGVWADVSMSAAWVGGGALGVVLGVAMISPIVGRPVMAGLGVVYRRIWGSVGVMAQHNATRNPRRTGATASALMIGVAIVSLMAVTGASANASIDKALEKDFVADYVVSSAVGIPFSPQVTADVAKVRGVKEVAAFRFDRMRVGKDQTLVLGIDPARIGVLGDIDMVRGKLRSLTPRSVSVRDEVATRDKLTVGSTVPLTRGARTVPFTVGAIHTESTALGADYLVSLSAMEALGSPKADAFAVITREPDAVPAQVARDLDDAVADLPVVSVKDQDEFADEQKSMVNTLLYIVYALLGLAVVIAILGIINTLALSVLERTREIGLLRAVGLSRRQLKRMLRLESVAISVLGALLGIAVGVAGGVALQRTLEEDGIDVLAVPWTQLLLFTGVAVVVGVVAAWLPGWRAARLDVLRAISTE